MEIRVRYRDTDSTGRVFFPRFLEFFDDAVIEFFRELGMTSDPIGYLSFDGIRRDETFVVGECHCRFLEETLFDDVLEVICQVKELGEKKIVLRFTCHNRTRRNICAEGYMTFICFDTGTKESAMIPEEVMRRLQDTQQGR